MEPSPAFPTRGIKSMPKGALLQLWPHLKRQEPEWLQVQQHLGPHERDPSLLGMLDKLAQEQAAAAPADGGVAQQQAVSLTLQAHAEQSLSGGGALMRGHEG